MQGEYYGDTVLYFKKLLEGFLATDKIYAFAVVLIFIYLC